eukprot:9113851-Alexandrium_andersonii.AAC.1
MSKEHVEQLGSLVLALTKLWPDGVLPGGVLSKAVEALDAENSNKLSCKRNKKNQRAWAKDEGDIIHA